MINVKEIYKAKASDNIRDLLAGIIVAFVSIPISMGYAEIAGLPAVYGLYGSLLPILLYGLTTSSRDFVFGVDAAPAALVGGALLSMGIQLQSQDAMNYVPLITLFTAMWLLLFGLIGAGKVVQFISDPVMGGFVTGICLEIIMMQVPKLMGGSAGSGEAWGLIGHILDTVKDETIFNPASLILGLATIAILLLAKKIIPKAPMSVVVMFLGAILTKYTGLISENGIKTLARVDKGLMKVINPLFLPKDMSEVAFAALTIAIVITAETLLASKSNASADGYKLKPNQEILAYAASNMAAALCGTCPVNGSVSRSGIVRQFGAKSQLMSLSAALSMLLILLFGTGFIQYLPVPVLTAIVVSALLGACEFDLGLSLFKKSKADFYIFLSAMLGVLLFGTIYGVLIGTGLSFIAVIRRAVAPPRNFLGIIPGREGFYSLERNKNSRPINDTIIYRFSGDLFFGNIDVFVNDIEDAIRYDTKRVIVYGSGISNIDVTAAERLYKLYKKLKQEEIAFYLTEHDGKVNDLLKIYGAGEMIKKGAVRLTVDTALRASGLRPPYEIEDDSELGEPQTNLLDGLNAEIEWAFGQDAEEEKERIVKSIVEGISKAPHIEDTKNLISIEKQSSWGRLAYMDEDEILRRVSDYISQLPEEELGQINASHLEELIEKRRSIIEEHIDEAGHRSRKRFEKRRERLERILNS